MCYTYDDLNRVTNRTIKNMSNVVLSEETFTYDAAGNVTSAPDSSFQYDINNRLISYNGSTLSYDADGNMLWGNRMGYAYDSANRLISAGGHAYTYNAEDVRIRNLCEDEDEDTIYTYNTNAKLSQLLMKTTNGAVTKYVYGRGLIGEEINSAFKTYHFDCRGSTIAITDASGTITDTFAYDTYGKLICRTGVSEVIFCYNGRDGVVTDENGLVYMRARYYSPDMRRFINADIVAGAISNAVTLNRFAYANGNPVSFVDPFGLSVWSWIQEKFEDTVDWAVETVEPIVDGLVSFFDPDSLELDGEFEEPFAFGSGRLSLGDSTIGASLGHSKSLIVSDEDNFFEGFYGAIFSLTVASAEGKIGLGNEIISLSISGDIDVLTAGANAGVHLNPGANVGAGASASVASGSIGVEFQILGLGISVGVSGSFLTVGASVQAGIINENEGTELDAKAEAKAGLFGLGLDMGILLPF
jgi:RHS repeat-associated protein